MILSTGWLLRITIVYPNLFIHLHHSFRLLSRFDTSPNIRRCFAPRHRYYSLINRIAWISQPPGRRIGENAESGGWRIHLYPFYLTRDSTGSAISALSPRCHVVLEVSSALQNLKTACTRQITVHCGVAGNNFGFVCFIHKNPPLLKKSYCILSLLPDFRNSWVVSMNCERV